MAKRGGLPAETRNYVVRITGRPAEQWTSREFARDPEATLMPAKAPCVEVAEEVAAQAKVVRVAKLMSELAAAAKAPPRDSPNDDKFDEAAWTIASAKPEWQAARAERRPRRAQEHQRAEGARGAGETAIKLAAKTAKTVRAWSRIADRTMRKAAENSPRLGREAGRRRPSRRPTKPARCARREHRRGATPRRARSR